MNQIVVMLTTAALFVFAVTAEARSQPITVNGAVELTGDTVTLGHLFNGLDTAVADQVIARAPAPGHQATLPTAWVARVATVYGVNWQPGRQDGPITLTRRSVAEQAALEAELTESLSREIATQQTVLPAAPTVVEAAVVAPEPTPAAPVQINQPVAIPVPVLVRRLGRGEVIEDSDLTWIDIPDDHRAAQYIVDAADLIGLSPSRGLSPFRPIRLGEVAPPMEVERGDSVTMRLTAGGLSITARGRALDAGSRGSVIRVLNIDSAQTIDAVVLGPGTVVVLANGQAPGTAVASL